MQPAALCLAFFLPASLACGAAAEPPGPAGTLHLATWNLEWLVSPRTARDSLNACDDGQRSALPCDVARSLRRDSGDRARLRAQARLLDADVIAFQEVEDEATAASLFRGYRICITNAGGVQQLGFAVRAGLPHRCEAPLPLGATRRTRPAASLRLFPGSESELTLVAVHLKSGCSTQALPESAAGTSACALLAGQARALSVWIDRQWRAGQRFVLMGDFNRAGPDDEDAFWRRLDPLGALRNASQGTRFRNCFIGQPFRQYIDHILVDAVLARHLVPASFRKHTYTNADAVRYRLSDHCPVSVKLNLGTPSPPRPAFLYK
jgi:endonuclease/exonuclease/phosphatase family metal-dependent hydrolase